MQAGKKLVVALVGAGLIAAVIGTVAHTRAENPATQPAAQTATAERSKPATISPEARPLLEQMRDAYAAIKDFSDAGHVHGEYNIDGDKQTHDADFSGSYASGKFRHEMKDDLLVGNTGEKTYIFLTPRNQYVTEDAPKDKVNLQTLGGPIASRLLIQNISLALVISGDALDELSHYADSIVRGKDVDIQGTSYPTLVLQQPEQDITLVIDPSTHLIRQEWSDQTRHDQHLGAKEIVVHKTTFDFTTTTTTPPDIKQFAWAPPAGSQVYSPGSGGDLDGKPAPAFRLASLDGKTISSADLKGSVYVLDFWATWCAPCVESLPKMDQAYKDLKGAGLTVFAVDMAEDKADVQKFVADKKLSVVVLLDSDSKVAEKYGIEAIPFTVVVGKDGKVRKSFLGSGHDDDIRKTCEAALKEK